jgi:hypothetical protein
MWLLLLVVALVAAAASVGEARAPRLLRVVPEVEGAASCLLLLSGQGRGPCCRRLLLCCSWWAPGRLDCFATNVQSLEGITASGLS